jgi:hypothetical protein
LQTLLYQYADGFTLAPGVALLTAATKLRTRGQQWALSSQAPNSNLPFNACLAAKAMASSWLGSQLRVAENLLNSVDAAVMRQVAAVAPGQRTGEH